MINYSATSAAVAIALVLYSVLRRRSAVRNILGPPSPSWIFGNMLQLWLAPVYGEHEFKWQKLYGPIYRLKGCFGQDRLMVADPLALQYILNTPNFEHSPLLEQWLDLLCGMDSVIVVKGEAHRRLRAALNPGFSASAVRSYQPVFERVAQTVSSIFLEYNPPPQRGFFCLQITARLESSSATSIDMCPLLGTATLSAVSEGTIHPELVASAISATQSATQILADAIASRLPVWLSRTAIYFPTAAFTALRKAKYVAKQLGDQVVREKLQAAKQGLEMNTDVYSLLLNLDESEKTGKVLSDEEVAAQTAIILIAGQDTTANTLVFALLELATHPEFQEKLRVEIHSTVGGGHGNVAYDNMPLLNAFIKEALRVYPAAAMVDRVAVRDTVIPLAESITTTTGERVSEISVQKRQLVTLALASYQRLESRWGEDANEFKPSRWIEGTPYQGEAVGPYANLLSFLGGSRTCLGWRFAILEMQVIIYELVGKFSFALLENDPVRARFAATLLPTVRSGKKGAPLCITRVL
ncbi:cytochrome P450 [Mycena epipterygia]|nr:cytochrome P450 [Mycena epipterygia]